MVVSLPPAGDVQAASFSCATFLRGANAHRLSERCMESTCITFEPCCSQHFLRTPLTTHKPPQHSDGSCAFLHTACLSALQPACGNCGHVARRNSHDVLLLGLVRPLALQLVPRIPAPHHLSPQHWRSARRSDAGIMSAGRRREQLVAKYLLFLSLSLSSFRCCCTAPSHICGSSGGPCA